MVGRLRELFLELVEVAERLLDRLGEGTGRLAAAALAGRGQDGPEQGVVEMPACVVPNNGTDRVGEFGNLRDHLLHRRLGPLGAFEGFVGVRDIRLMVFAVVNLHGLASIAGSRAAGSKGKAGRVNGIEILLFP